MSNILFFQDVVEKNKLKDLILKCLCCNETIRFEGSENILDEVYFCEHCHYPINF